MLHTSVKVGKVPEDVRIEHDAALAYGLDVIYEE